MPDFVEPENRFRIQTHSARFCHIFHLRDIVPMIYNKSKNNKYITENDVSFYSC